MKNARTVVPRRPRKQYYVAPGAVTPDDNQHSAFMKNTYRLMLGKGWTQADLAREAERHLPKGHRFGRHLISAYMTGKNLPSPMNLEAMAKALGVKSTDIIPETAARYVAKEPTTMQLTTTLTGQTRIVIDMEMSAEKAFRILSIINEGRS